uniref:Lipocalin n=1 Tax=Rhipicephalus zambeziensis TaxID=60191 RepID=A0A224YHR2_9ACAR
MTPELSIRIFIIVITVLVLLVDGNVDFEQFLTRKPAYWIFYSNETTNDSCIKYTRKSYNHYKVVLNETFNRENKTSFNKIDGQLNYKFSYWQAELMYMMYFVPGTEFTQSITKVLSYQDSDNKCAVIDALLFSTNLPKGGSIGSSYPVRPFFPIQARELVSPRFLYLPTPQTFRRQWRELWVSFNDTHNFDNSSACMKEFKKDLTGRTVKPYSSTCQ